LRRLFQKSVDFENHPNFLGEFEALGARSLVDLTNSLFRKAEDGSVTERRLSLEVLMSTPVQFQALEPHDTVYSVMSLVSDTSINGSSVLMAAAVVESPTPKWSSHTTTF
jgi:hypothetical protein